MTGKATDTGLDARRFQRLEADARAMAGASCRSYLAAATQCLRDTRDPVAAVELLRAMWHSGHASRDNEKIALDHVGRWLERRIHREPGVHPDQLALELGWLSRMNIAHQAGPNPTTQGDRNDRPPRGRRAARRPGFGDHLAQLRTRRQRAVDLARPDAGRQPEAARRQPPPPPAPTQLPDQLEVSLVSIEQARDAWKAARKRRKQRRPPRDRLLDILPTTAELRPLASNLACSLLDTEGMDELYDRTVANDGLPPRFHVAVPDLIDRDGKRVARRIWFD